MDPLAEVRELQSQGRFASALRTLDSIRVALSSRLGADVVKIELLEHVGHFAQARALALTLLRSKTLPDGHRATCELVLARVERENGQLASGVTHLQKAVSFAASTDDVEQTCWLQLHLLRRLVDLSGPESASELLAEIRTKVRALGSNQLTAALHIFVGQIEAKRGLVDS